MRERRAADARDSCEPGSQVLVEGEDLRVLMPRLTRRGAKSWRRVSLKSRRANFERGPRPPLGQPSKTWLRLSQCPRKIGKR